MASIQSGLWCAFSGPEFLNEIDSCAKNKPQRMAQAEAIYDEMYEKFAATLTAKQRAAFYGLTGMSATIQIDCLERGIAAGLVLARELAAFLADPTTAMRQAVESYLPFEQAEAHSLRAINAYLAEATNEKEKAASVLQHQKRQGAEAPLFTYSISGFAPKVKYFKE